MYENRCAVNCESKCFIFFPVEHPGNIKEVRKPAAGSSRKDVFRIIYKIKDMKSIELVTKLREQVIENDNRIYQNLLDTTTNAKDPIWQGILPIYKGLSNNQQVAFLQFLRMIQVNTLSHVLGILDGSSYITENGESFILKTEGKDEMINGYLQDIFLEMEEL